MMMNSRRLQLGVFVFSFLLMLVATEALDAQSRRGGRSRFGSGPKSEVAFQERMNFEKSLVEELRRAALEAGGDQDKQGQRIWRFRGMAHSVLRELKAEEFAKLKALDKSAAIREIVRLWKLRQKRKLDRWVESQPEAVRRELAQMDAAARKEKMLDFRANESLDRAVSKAIKHGIINTEEASALASLSREKKLLESRRLYRAAFIEAHRGDWNAAEVKRLKALPEREFWRDPKVRGRRLSHALDSHELGLLKGLKGKQRQALIKALRAGQLETLKQESWMDAKSYAKLAELKPKELRKLARDLERIHFRRFRGFAPPRNLRSKLTRDQWGKLRECEDEAQALALLQAWFPQEDWALHKQRHESLKRIRAFTKNLSGHDRMRLMRMNPEQARELLLAKNPNNPAEVDEILSLMKSSGFYFRPPRGFPLLPAVAKTMKPEALRELKSKPDEEKAKILAAQFGAEYEKAFDKALVRAKLERPEAWGSWGLLERYRFLESKRAWSHRNRGGPRGMKRRGRSGGEHDKDGNERRWRPQREQRENDGRRRKEARK